MVNENEKITSLNQEMEDYKKLLHIHVNVLNTHINQFKQHELTEASNYSMLLNKVNETCENTAGLVDMWRAATGTIKVLNIIGSIIKWIAGIGAGVSTLWLLLHIQLPGK